ncbi:amino acid ABC transporter ATP-binding protein, partial [Mesorhizobium sp. M4B.F.Ca.ET.203.01.1.1]
MVFDQVQKRFGDFTALAGFSDRVGKNEVIVLCGPSGSGKSTLVRTVNRLETLQGGRVLVHGQDVA